MSEELAKPNGAAALEIAEYRILTSILLDRLQFMRQAGITYDGVRDEYVLFGYDRVVTAKQYRDEYARGGLAKRIVESYPKATWRGGVELYEDEDPDATTAFEKEWKQIEDNHNVWAVLYAVDVLSRLSQYAVILIGAPGDLSTELPRGKPGSLLYLQPFTGGGGPGPNQSSSISDSYCDATIETFDKNPASKRFGEPLTYRLKRTDVASPLLDRPVHWSRIIHVAEGCLDNKVYGQPALECVWNLLIDLRKVTGGGAESFFQRAKQLLHLDLDKDMNLSPEALDALKTSVEEFKHKITSTLQTRGVTASKISDAVANFENPVDAILKQVAGTTSIPLRILTGSEMGELASTQDESNWRTQVQDRRTGYAGPLIVRRLADRLIEYGYLSKPAQYEVGWPVEEDLDESEKADLAVKLANTNKTFGSLVFTDDFIREKTFDLKPLTDAERQADSDRAAERMKQQQEAMAATKQSEDTSNVVKSLKVVPKAAEDHELVRLLTEAIEARNYAVIDRILGMERPPQLPVPLHLDNGGVALCGRETNAEFLITDVKNVTCANCLNQLGGAM